MKLNIYIYMFDMILNILHSQRQRNENNYNTGKNDKYLLIGIKV